MAVADWLVYHLWVESSVYSRHFYWFDPDCVCVLAFGRNTWTDEEVLEGALSPVFNGLDPERDWLSVFERLRQKRFEPGRPNRLLAEACHNAVMGRQKNGHRLPLPVHVFIQWEVLYALWADERMRSWVLDPRFGTYVPIWPKDGEYLSSRGVLERTKALGKERGLSSPQLVAQLYHMPRVERIACKLFGDNKVSIGPTVYAREEEDYFDPNSQQDWTKNRRHFLFSETLRRLHHTLLRWT